MQARSFALAGSFLLGMIASCKDGGGNGGLIDRGACDLLIECATQIAPEAHDEYVSVYGPFGTCWQNPQAWAACRDFCRQTLDALNLAGMITGETCGTCMSNADCAQYGPTAYCDAGLCLGGGGGMSDGETGDASGGDGDGDGDGDVPIEAVSILLVLDNSATMSRPQRTLAVGAHQIVEPLDAAGIPWRLGVTTTDNGNPWCESSSPESGKLVFSSCHNRIGEFLGLGGDIDSQDYACYDICSLPEVETIATGTASDPILSPRPWIESDGSQTNLADDVALADALPCIIPQGINGCGFESQLYSARLTVGLSNNPDEPEYGFVEPGRLLVVVYITDESDCSYNPDWGEIFSQAGNREFWSDPEAQFPTSAICWNAGMQCTGDPSGYDDCTPVNLDVNGNPADLFDNTVMLPVQNIIELMGNPEHVLAFGIVGVNGAGEPVYADVGDVDPDYQNIYGIGPSCAAQTSFDFALAVPPGRIWTVLEELGPDSGQRAWSICDESFDGGLAAIGNAIVAEF